MQPSALKIHVTKSPDGLSVALTPPVPPPMGTFLQGKSAEDASVLVGRIFNICAAAQEAAARSAFRLDVTAEMTARIRNETLREHIVKLCLVWPPLLDLLPDRTAPAQCARALDDRDAGSALRSAVFASMKRVPLSLDELVTWAKAEETVPARLFHKVLTDWRESWGSVSLPVFDADKEADWPEATQGEVPVENGIAGRVMDHPLMISIEEKLGRGTVWRMAARLVEVDRLLAGEEAHPVIGPGVVAAARGTMLVRASSDETGVTGFERLSPTDFAIHPGGTLQTALESLPAAHPNLGAMVRVVVETIDPCVSIELDIDDA